jgi:3D (Asp-Asp-Asp) domain-containing protein
MKIGRYKLTNPKRFVIFILIVIFIITFVSLVFYTNNVCVEKIEENLRISEEVKNSILIEVDAEEIEDENLQEDFLDDFNSTTTEEETVIEPKFNDLGSFTVTAYCCCKICCGKEPEHPAYGITASGKRATEGRTIAVDPSIIPLGTTVYLNGNPYIAEDTGSAIKGKKIDLFINDHQRAKVFGVQEMEVKI